ncbi:MAG: hypothetical protein PHC70_01670 [Patescibacteria group bacterium]|nr:hypothetical protein [Patescibacteria group bacterium]
MKFPKFLIVIACFIPWIIGAGVLFWIMALRFPMTGVFIAQSDMTGQSAFIYPFLPGERTTSPGKQEDGWSGQRIINDPVYMNVRTPGPYETVDVDVEFRTLRQSLLEFGLVKDAEGKQLDLYPMYSEMLEGKDWKQVATDKGSHGYVTFNTPVSRLDDKDTRGLAIWGTTTTSPLISGNLLGEQRSYSVNLRGSHDFWVTPGESQIKFRLDVQDVNRNRSGGMLALQVYRDNQLIWQDTAGTSGNRDQGYGAVIPVNVNLKDLRPGVYRIKVTADDDVFIRRVVTKNSLWVVGPRLVAGDIVGFATTSTNSLKVWTTARHIVAETFHKEGLQDVQFGPTVGSVKRTHTSFRIDRNDSIVDPVALTAPRGDIRLVADGYFAFAPDAFFEPQPRRLTPETNGKQEGLQAVLTDYSRVEDLGDGWKKTHLSFPVTPDLDTLRFVLSAPGIASRAGSVDIRHITLTYHREPVSFKTWWSLLLAEAKRAWRRL